MNIVATEQPIGTTLINGTTGAVAFAIFHETINAMVPYLLIATLVIIADLYYGIRAAKLKGEVVRVSRAIRRTLSKTMEYLCWVAIGAALSVAFGVDWLDGVVVACVMAVESISLISNALYCKGYRVIGLEKAVTKYIGKKINADLDGVELEKREKDETGTDKDGKA